MTNSPILKFKKITLYVVFKNYEVLTWTNGAVSEFDKNDITLNRRSKTMDLKKIFWIKLKNNNSILIFSYKTYMGLLKKIWLWENKWFNEQSSFQNHN